MTLAIRDLTPGFVGEVSGIDITVPLDPGEMLAAVLPTAGQ